MTALTFPQLETLYDELASAIDRVGPEGESVFLVKLVLSLAREFGDARRVSALIEDCLSEPIAPPAGAQRLL